MALDLLIGLVRVMWGIVLTTFSVRMSAGIVVASSIASLYR